MLFKQLGCYKKKNPFLLPLLTSVEGARMRRNSCCEKQKLRKGLWSPEEDEKLYNYIKRFGVGCWSSVPKLAGLQRCGKSCRLRWINYLRPDLKRGMFSQEEEHLIISLHEALGNRWAQIATQLPGRTDNEIKNFWNSSLKKKLMKQGIDPSTHKPVAGSVRESKDSADASLLHILQSPNKGIQSLESTAVMDQQQGFPFNYVSKQAFEPLFLSEFQSGVENDGFQANFHHLMRPFDPLPGFNTMPNLTNFDHQSIIDATEYSDNSGSRMSNVQTNQNALENGGMPAFPWDIEDKIDSMFPFQFNAGMQHEDRKVIIPWQEARHNQNPGGHYGNYPTIASMAQELNGVNLDVFQQI